MAHKRPAYTLREILSRTKREGDCMIWQGGKHRQGYAMMRQDGEMRTVHSVVAELQYGERPSKHNGTRVTRTCKNKLCINPDHIVIKRTSDIKRRRYHCKNRKITQEQAREIRAKFKAGGWGMGRKLSEEYNINKHTIYAICSNKLYKELPDENG